MKKKILASFLGLTMALMMFPGMAQGQTVEELQDQIADLLAQIAILQGQVAALTGGTATGVPAVCAGITFTVDLSQGSTGNDVKCLQALLNTDPATQLGTTGAGSPGNETTYFGPLTHAAVVKFQNLHAAEILTPIGLTAGTGYVGPATRPVLNAMLTAAPECTVDTDCLTGYMCVGGECVLLPEECTVDADCPAGYECVAGTCQAEEPGEAAEGILTAQINPTPASGVKVYEGNTEKAVMGILLKAKLSDITVQRITFNFGTTRIYDYMTYLTLYDGETVIADVNLNSSTVYKSGGNYYAQVAGFDVEVPKDGSKVLTVKVDALPGYPSWLAGLLPHTTTLTVDINAIRGVDSAGIIQYAPGTAFSRGFTANSTLAASAALTVSRNADSPLPFNVGTGSLGTASEVEVLKFNVKAEYDDVKITDITNLVVAVGTVNQATSGVVYLYDGADVVGSAAVVGTDADFTDMEIMVAQDTTKTLTVKADYSSASTTLTTSTITVDSASIAAENSLGMTVTSLSGTAASYPVYLYTIAPTLALSSSPTIEKHGATEVASSTADAVIKFTAKAEGGDVTVAETGAVTAGYSTTTYTGVTTTGVTLTYEVTGAGTPSGGVYTIAKDTTATITVNVNVSAATLPAGWKAVYGYVTLTGVTWNTSETTNWMADIFKTGKVILP